MVTTMSLSFSQCDYDIGDINQDNILDVIDIIATVNIVLNNTESVESADINGDGEIDILDIISIVNIILSKAFK